MKSLCHHDVWLPLKGLSIHICAVESFADAWAYCPPGFFPERRNEPFGIAREQNAGCIGKRLATARDGELDEHRADWRENGKHNRDDEKYLPRLAIVIAATATTAHPAEMSERRKMIGDQAR